MLSSTEAEVGINTRSRHIIYAGGEALGGEGGGMTDVWVPPRGHATISGGGPKQAKAATGGRDKRAGSKPQPESHERDQPSGQ